MKSLRNLFYVLRRFTMASLLNIIGLSIAFASFCLIMMQVSYEQNYNHCHKNIDRICRLEWIIEPNTYAAVSQRPLAKVLAQSPHVEYMSFFAPGIFNQKLIVVDGEEKRTFMNTLARVSESFPKIFSFEFTQGDDNAFEQPNSIIIPESLAKNYFHNVPALGQTIIFEESSKTITGVYKDFPKNSTIKNIIYGVLSPSADYSDWTSCNDIAFFLFDSPENIDGVLDEMVHLINPEPYGCGSQEELKEKLHSLIRFNRLDDIYYSNQVKYVFSDTGSRQTTLLLIGVALIIILIAGINFTNFSTSLTPMRIKGINTRKILGSSSAVLRRSLVAEGILVSFLAFLISLVLVYLCRGTFIEGFITSGISISGQYEIIVLTAAISIVTGFMAGLYPAFYMTSFSPAIVLKGSFGLSPKGRTIRTILLCIQYITSISLLIVATFIILQNRHMFTTSFGYDKDQIVIVEVNETIHQSEKAFVNSLTVNENIEYVGFSFTYISCMDDAPNWGRELNGEHFQFYCLVSSVDLPKALGLKFVEGRDFLDSDGQTPGGAFIFNKCAQRQIGLNVGDDLGGQPIVGIFEDISYSSFRRPIEPMAFILLGTDPTFWEIPLNSCYIRIKKGANYDASIKHIENTLKEYDPVTPFTINNLNSEIESAYKREKSISSLVSLFGILSIIISLVGVYGLVVFETEYKRKEIGVRKVFGSTTGEIMKMFSLSYIKLIIICSVIAIPLSYYFVQNWLSQFQSRTHIYWWVFVLAFLAIILITLLTCSYQNYRAASTNPARTIKSE